jgi:hypothetical protein
LPYAYLLVAIVASLNLLGLKCKTGNGVAIFHVNRSTGGAVGTCMKLHRFVPMLVVALTVLALVSACGGKGGGY